MSLHQAKILSLPEVERNEIDARIFEGKILFAIKKIMECCRVYLAEAKGLHRARYKYLRERHADSFCVSDDEYWACYSEG